MATHRRGVSWARDADTVGGPRLPVQNVTLVISSLCMGGAERVMSSMATYWARGDCRVTLITLGADSEDFWSVDPGVKRVSLNLSAGPPGMLQSAGRNLQRLLKLRREIRRSKPDVVLSFLDVPNILSIVACWGLGIPVIVSERIDPGVGTAGRLGGILRRWIYPGAFRVVTQTTRARDNLPALIRERTVVIPNPILVEEATAIETPVRPSRRPRVVGLGRLEEQKRFDLLMRAFSAIKDRHPAWRLVILGEGSRRSELEALRTELGLEDRVSLPGRTSDVPAALRESDLFVLSSDYEGFPNALCEAMACGLPVIATDCPSGPREIIRNGIDGILTQPDDVDALAAAMDRLMASEAERSRLSGRAVEILDRFGMEKVMGMWEDLFAEAAHLPRKATAPL